MEKEEVGDDLHGAGVEGGEVGETREVDLRVWVCRREGRWKERVRVRVPVSFSASSARCFAPRPASPSGRHSSVWHQSGTSTKVKKTSAVRTIGLSGFCLFSKFR